MSDSSPFTWSEALAEFLLHLQATRALKTVRYYEVQLSQLAKWALKNDVAFEQFGKRHFSFEVMVSLIGSVRPQAGLVVDAVLDRGFYPTKIAVSDDELASVRLLGHDFHREWNYTIEPRNR